MRSALRNICRETSRCCSSRLLTPATLRPSFSIRRIENLAEQKQSEIRSLPYKSLLDHNVKAPEQPPIEKLKRTTGFTGLAVVPNAREVFINRCEVLLDLIKEYGTNPYNDQVQKFTTFYLKTAKENEDLNKIEAVIDEGQMEELIEYVERELQLCVYLNEMDTPKLWDYNPDIEELYRDQDFPYWGDPEWLEFYKRGRQPPTHPPAPRPSASQSKQL